MSNRRKPATEHEPCWAGRKAFAGGRWSIPCTRSMEPTHVITDPDTPGAPEVKLCTYHYEWVLSLGLVSEPNPTPERIAAYEDERKPELGGAVGRRASFACAQGEHDLCNGDACYCRCHEGQSSLSS